MNEYFKYYQYGGSTHLSCHSANSIHILDLRFNIEIQWEDSTGLLVYIIIGIYLMVETHKLKFLNFRFKAKI